VEYVIGRSSDAAQLVFVGSKGALFGACTFVLKDAPEVDYFMTWSVGSEAHERINAIEQHLENRATKGEDVPERRRPQPTLSTWHYTLWDEC